MAEDKTKKNELERAELVRETRSLTRPEALERLRERAERRAKVRASLTPEELARRALRQLRGSGLGQRLVRSVAAPELEKKEAPANAAASTGERSDAATEPTPRLRKRQRREQKRER